MKTTLEKIIDFNDELNEYSYGLVYNNQVIETTMDDSLFDKYYKTLSYDEFKKYKCGVCWDYTDRCITVCTSRKFGVLAGMAFNGNLIYSHDYSRICHDGEVSGAFKEAIECEGRAG